MADGDAETIAIAVGVSGLVLVLIGVIIFIVFCLKRRDAQAAAKQTRPSIEDGWNKPPKLYNPALVAPPRGSWGVMPQRYLSFADLPVAPTRQYIPAISAEPYPTIAAAPYPAVAPRPYPAITAEPWPAVTQYQPEFDASQYTLEFETPYGTYMQPIDPVQPYTPQYRSPLGATEDQAVPIFTVQKPEPPRVISLDEFKAAFTSIPKPPGIIELEEKFPLPAVAKPPPVDTTFFDKFKADFMASFNDTKEKFKLFQEFTLPDVPTIPKAKLIDLNTQAELPKLQPIRIQMPELKPIVIPKPKPLPPIVIPKPKPLEPLVIPKLEPIVIPEPKPLPALQPIRLIRPQNEPIQMATTVQPPVDMIEVIELPAQASPPVEVIEMPAPAPAVIPTHGDPTNTYWMQPAPQNFYRLSYLPNGNAIYQ